MASAQEYCVSPLPMAEEVQPSEKGFSRFSNLWLVPDFEQAFINLGTSSVLTISDGTLVPFVMPPLAKDNRVVPHFFVRTNGETWAFERITKSLYRLDQDSDTFVEIELTNDSEITAEIAYGPLRPYPDLSSSGHSVPALYVSTGARLENTFEVTETGLAPIDVPSDWFRGGYPPITFDEIGSFLEAQGRMMFRRDGTKEWAEIGRYENIVGPMAQRQFSSFINAQVLSDDTFQLILNDRVMVGRFDGSMLAPSLDYQIAGQAVVHQPTGEVLVFPDEPHGNRADQDAPSLVNVEPLLHIAAAKQPQIPGGFRAMPQTVGPSIHTTSVFHKPTGLTLVTHAKGIAAFGQSGLTDVAIPSWHSYLAINLVSVGDRYVAHVIGQGFYEITEDLQFREIQFPEVGASIEISFSETLGQFIASSFDWQAVYTSTDLRDFSEVGGASTKIRDFVGDIPSENAAMLISASSAYLLGSCDVASQTND